MAEMQEVVNIALTNDKTLQAALEVANANCIIKRYLLEKVLINKLKEILPNSCWKLTWHWPNDDCFKPEAHIDIRCPEATHYTASFEFISAGCNRLEYGILRNPGLPDLPDVRECLNRRIGKGKKTKNRPWYRAFQPYGDWSVQVEPWLEIQNGTMADKIIGKTKEIYDALRDAGLLHQLSGNTP